MSLLGTVGSVSPQNFGRVAGPNLADAPHAAHLGKLLPGAAPAGDFGSVFDHLVSAVDAKQQQAAAITRQVLLGDNDQLHQSVIAMQEASVAFSLMVEVRNKLVDSYQELMRMPV
ncbi:MAG: flagellar hook-basal body complex protein FliE [Opitutae bacterium]|nr:flagellar hook-basal body complex protein FliE [Opitutae bacterium]